MPLSRQRKGTTHPYYTTADDSHFTGHGQILHLEQRAMESRAYNNLAWLEDGYHDNKSVVMIAASERF
ncbi:hypothetical protein [Ensifer canadensis]|uniref:hypothetical protein n=1 Tax=Ensifer canadensis TaxID=555315 RepID=UPI0035E3D529